MPQSVVAYTIAVDDLGKVLTKIEEPKNNVPKRYEGQKAAFIASLKDAMKMAYLIATNVLLDEMNK